MGATFKQDAINLREEVAKLSCLPAKVAQNTQDLLPLQAYTGKNLLINADKSVSQRGDYSSPTATVALDYWVDRYLILSNIATNKQHKPFEEKAGHSKVLRIEATAAGNGYFQNQQKIEGYADLVNRTVTYSAMIRTNRTATLGFGDGVGSSQVECIADGEWHLYSTNLKIDASPTQLKLNIGSTISDIAIGDYIEIGNEMLELGSEFTGFEYVPPQIQLANCQRYFTAIYPAIGNGRLGIAQRISTSGACLLILPLPTEMRATPDVSVSDVTSVAAYNETASAYYNFTAVDNTAGSNKRAISITLTAAETGYTVGQAAGVIINSSLVFISADAEI